MAICFRLFPAHSTLKIATIAHVISAVNSLNKIWCVHVVHDYYISFSIFGTVCYWKIVVQIALSKCSETGCETLNEFIMNVTFRRSKCKKQCNFWIRKKKYTISLLEQWAETFKFKSGTLFSALCCFVCCEKPVENKSLTLCKQSKFYMNSTVREYRINMNRVGYFDI